MKNWNTFRIKDICNIIGGNPAPKGDNAFIDGDIPFVKMKDLGKCHLTDNLVDIENKISEKVARINRLKLVKRGSILLPRSGSVALNHRAILGIDAYMVSHICALEIKDESLVNNLFLYYLLTRVRMDKITRKTTGLDAITFEDLGNLILRIPSIDDQIRITTILSCAQTIITKRKESIRLLDELLKSIFLKMFGDSVRNEKEWEEIPLRELLDNLKYGTNTKAIEYQKTGNEMPVLRIPNVVEGKINYSDLKYVSVNEREAEQLTLDTGDILFVRSNGNPNYIGRCAVYNDDFVNNKFVYASYLIRARINKPYKIHPEIIATIINSDSFRKIIVKEAKTTAGNYNINMEGLSKLRIINPDIEKQEKYLLLKEKVESVRAKYELSLREYEKLYTALCQRAFRGELDLSRIPVDDDIKPDPAKQKSEGHAPEALATKKLTSDELIGITGTKPGRQIISSELWGGLDQVFFEEPSKHDEVSDIAFDILDVGKLE